MYATKSQDPFVGTGAAFSEKRGFERSSHRRIAWVALDLDRSVTCRVINTGPDGALLEFDGVPPPADEFVLFLDDGATQIRCLVRHRQTHSLGVKFERVTPTVIKKGAVGVDRRSKDKRVNRIDSPAHTGRLLFLD